MTPSNSALWPGSARSAWALALLRWSCNICRASVYTSLMHACMLAFCVPTQARAAHAVHGHPCTTCRLS